MNKGNVERLKRLLDDRAYVNSKNIVGETLMHVAARMGHKNVIDVLLDHGADAHHKDKGVDAIKTSQDKSNPAGALLHSLNQSVKEGESLLTRVADKPVTTIEGATGGTAEALGTQIRITIDFFSPATRIQAANSTEAEQHAEVQLTAANLGK